MLYFKGLEEMIRGGGHSITGRVHMFLVGFSYNNESAW